MASPKTTQPITSVAQWTPEILDQLLTEDDLSELSLVLTPYSAKWNIIGVDLGLPQHKIRTIRVDYQESETRNTEMIHAWLIRGRNCTRRALLNVLQNRGYISSVDEEDPVTAVACNQLFVEISDKMKTLVTILISMDAQISNPTDTSASQNTALEASQKTCNPVSMKISDTEKQQPNIHIPMDAQINDSTDIPAFQNKALEASPASCDPVSVQISDTVKSQPTIRIQLDAQTGDPVNISASRNRTLKANSYTRSPPFSTNLYSQSHYNIEFKTADLGKYILTFASKIIMVYPRKWASCRIPLTHLHVVKTYLARYKAYWKAIGNNFGVSQEELNEINDKNDNDLDKLEQVIKYWILNSNSTLLMLLEVVQMTFTYYTISIKSQELIIEYTNSNNHILPKDFWTAKCELKNILKLLQALTTDNTLTKKIQPHLGIPVHLPAEIAINQMRSHISPTQNITRTTAILQETYDEFLQNHTPLLVLSVLFINDSTEACDIINMPDTNIETSQYGACGFSNRIDRNDLLNCLESVETFSQETKTTKLMIKTYQPHIYGMKYGMDILFITMLLVMLIIALTSLLPIALIFLTLILGLTAIHSNLKPLLLKFHFRLNIVVIKLIRRNYELTTILGSAASGIIGFTVTNALGITTHNFFGILTMFRMWIKHANDDLIAPTTTTSDIYLYHYLKTLAVQMLLGCLATIMAVRLLRSGKNIKHLPQLLLLGGFTLITVLVLFWTSYLTYPNLVWAMAGATIIYALHRFTYKYKYITLYTIIQIITLHGYLASTTVMSIIGNYIYNHPLTNYAAAAVTGAIIGTFNLLSILYTDPYKKILKLKKQMNHSLILAQDIREHILTVLNRQQLKNPSV